MLQDVKLPNFSENRAFFSGEGAIANYQSIYKTAQGIWRRIGKVKEVFEQEGDLAARGARAGEAQRARHELERSFHLRAVVLGSKERI